MTAGLGTRLLPYTKSLAKPLIPVCGIPLLQFTLDQLRHGGITQVAANVHHMAQMTQSAMRFLEGGNQILFSDESRELLGSGGGVRTMSGMFFKNEPFLYVNGDELLNIDYLDIKKHHQYLKHRVGAQITMVCLAKSPGQTPYSEILLDERRGLVRKIGEKKLGSTKFAGVAVIENQAISHLDLHKPYDLVQDVLLPKIRAGRVGFLMVENHLEDYPRSWFDLGTPELWLNTQLSLLHWLEQKDAPRAWRERLDRTVLRLGRNIFTTRSSGLTKAPESWSGPCFWAPQGAAKTPPINLGPNAVLYGEILGRDEFQSGIGHSGIWTDVSV